MRVLGSMSVLPSLELPGCGARCLKSHNQQSKNQEASCAHKSRKLDICLDQASLPVEAAAPVVLEERAERDPKGFGAGQCSASLF